MDQFRQGEETVYRRGVPLDPDVRKIREAYPDSSLHEGQIITYAKISELIREPKESNRFKSVVSKWLSDVFEESGITLKAVPNTGYKVLDDCEKVDFSHNKLKSAVRSATKSFKVAHTVDTNKLTDEKKKLYDFDINKSAKIVALNQIKSRAQLPSLTE